MPPTPTFRNLSCWLGLPLTSCPKTLLAGMKNPAIALDANAAEPYNARGLSRLQVGKNKDALQDFAAAVNRNKQSAEFWTNLGIAQIRTGDVQRGRESINRALVLKPGYGPARQALSSAPAQG